MVFPLVWVYNGRMPWRSRVRFYLSVLALLCLAAALLVVLHPAGDPYIDLMRQGADYASGARRTASVAAYRQASALRPDAWLPYLRLAEVYLDWGRSDDALAALAGAEARGARESDPVEVERLWVAVSEVRADWDGVVEHAQQLLDLAPSDREARHSLAGACVELQDWETARDEYRTLVEGDRGDRRAQERLGALLVGDDPAAIQHLFAAGTDLAERLLAVLREQGVEENAAFLDASLGRVLFEHREWALSTRLFEKALAARPGYASAHAHLGLALDRMGRPAAAEPHLRWAVVLAPASPLAHTFLGLHYDRLGELEMARAAYETAYDLDRENPAICVEIGQTWAAEGEYDTAEIWLAEAVSLRPDDPALWEILARFYLGHNISPAERGAEAVARLLELAPDSARAHDLRGWAALQTGEYEVARESLNRALELDPTLASAHYHMGLLWRAWGDPDRARAAFIRALDLDTSGALVPAIERVLGGAPR